MTVVGSSLTAVDIDATSAFALTPDAVAWLRGRGRSAAVVDAGGNPELVAPARVLAPRARHEHAERPCRR